MFQWQKFEISRGRKCLLKCMYPIRMLKAGGESIVLGKLKQ